MNQTEAGIERVGLNQYRALVRFPWQAELRPAKKDGKPLPTFPTEYAAMRAANQCVLEWINGQMRRDGVTICPTRAAAEKLFTRANHGEA